MSKHLCLLLYLLFLVKPSTLCKYFNNTCYKLFFSDGNGTRITSLDNITDVGGIWRDYKNNANGTYSCIEPGYEKICSGHGRCLVETCVCDRLEYSNNETESPYAYSGKYCEECPYCKGQRCKEILNCLNYILDEKNCSSYCHIYYNLVDKVKRYSYDEKMCDVGDKDGCRFRFKYIYNENNEILIDAEKQKRCLSGRMYLHICCYGFLIYIFGLMIIFKKCL